MNLYFETVANKDKPLEGQSLGSEDSLPKQNQNSFACAYSFKKPMVLLN